MRHGTIRLISLVFLAVSAISTVSAQTSVPADLGEYMDLVARLRGLAIERQIDELKRYVESHPESEFREEIETNLTNLNKFLANTDPTKKKDERDTDLYLRAVGLSKTLSPLEQIALWQQFLRENPDTLYKKDILYKLTNLKAKTPGASVAPATPSPTGRADSPVVRRLDYKDKDKALLLAIFPGLVVPGMAHWYTKDHLIAGLLTAFRIAGLGIGMKGVYERSNKVTIVGGVLAGFSYAADIIDAPYTVERYNDKLEADNPLPVALQIGPRSLLVSYNF